MKSYLNIIILLIFFIFFKTFSVNSQNVFHRNLSWLGSEQIKLADNVEVSLLRFEGAVYNGSAKFLPYYNERFSVSDVSQSYNVQIINPVFKEIEGSFTFEGEIPSDVRANATFCVENKKGFIQVSILPVRKKSDGKYEQLISFDLRLSPQINKLSRVSSASRVYTASSVLSSGNWYKIGVTSDGVYKLTYSFLQSCGINPASIDPKNISIYGNGLGMLPHLNSLPRPDDLLENSIYVSGEQDGKFDSEDFILFFAKGPHQWKYNKSEKKFDHFVNLFTDTSYYFITIKDVPGKRISPAVLSNSSPSNSVTYFNDYLFHEKNERNFIKSGREWYGEIFDVKTSQDFNFYFKNLDYASPVTIVSDVIARSFASSSFDVKVNGNLAMKEVVNAVPTLYYSDYAAPVNTDISTKKANVFVSSDLITINLTYNKSTGASVGYLNFLELNARRKLTMDGTQMSFRDLESVGTGKISTFTLDNAGSNITIWEVTDPVNVKAISTIQVGNSQVFTLNTDSLREFIAFSNGGFLTPSFSGMVVNQNLHALPQVNMIIISHPAFLSEAQRLQHFHHQQGLTVELVTPQQIYNEFSSGAQDITAIRDFVKMFYDRAQSYEEQPHYLLFFGDASYDYKNRIPGNTNLVPTYQSLNSLSPTSSYVSDDYFGLLDENEGALLEDNNSFELLDLNIGRIPVQTLQQARNGVDKIIHYSSAPSISDVQKSTTLCENSTTESGTVFGDWRNIVCFVADDEDANTHLRNANAYADSIVGKYNKNYNVDKIYFDAYQQISTPGGQRYPDVRSAIVKRVEKGALIVNYTGHGGEVGWAHERVLEVSDITGWTNYNNLPLFVTATCEFTRFDDPERTSAGEWVFLNPKGGGIALLTTVRLVFSSTNDVLNTKFYKNVFTPVNNQMPTLGEVFKRTKNDAGSNRNFTLIGDPAITLAYPQYKIVTTSINEKNTMDTLRALSKVTVKGYVQDKNGSVKKDFNGTIYPTVYDKPLTIQTLRNDDASFVTTFRLQKNVLFKGKASVKDGEFQFTFIVPKDIQYSFAPGKISYYAENGQEDANGYSENFIIGGSSKNVVADNKGPNVKLYLNEESFAPGGITDEKPIMYAVVSDSSGINTVGTGIGHDITAVLDNEMGQMLVLNDYYQSDLNSYQKGKVSYRFSSLSEGKHTLKFKVWDVHNNSSETYIDFIVANSADFALRYVLNYPNPFTTRTSFYFEHNKPCVPLNVQIQIFTVSGALIKTINVPSVHSEGYRIGPIDWDGTDDFGDKIGRGVYLYKLKVTSASDGSSVDKIEKLVILN